MYKQITMVTLIAVLVTGCQLGSAALDQAGTMVAQTVAAAPPTVTPEPTFTPLPTNTAMLRLTPTPNIALTSTLEAFHVLSELDVYVGENSGIPYEEGYLAWHQIDPVTIDMSGPQKDAGVFQIIGENINATNFIFTSNVTWNASGILICGFAFRGESDLNMGKQYQFYFYRISGLPAYKIDVYEFGVFKNTISGVKFSSGINSNNNAANDFILIAQNEQFTVFVNGEKQGQFYDSSKQQMDGLLAFLAWQDSGKGSCKFNNSSLWILP
jgi:hypothetical protein